VDLRRLGVKTAWSCQTPFELAFVGVPNCVEIVNEQDLILIAMGSLNYIYVVIRAMGTLTKAGTEKSVTPTATP